MGSVKVSMIDRHTELNFGIAFIVDSSVHALENTYNYRLCHSGNPHPTVEVCTRVMHTAPSFDQVGIIKKCAV